MLADQHHWPLHRVRPDVLPFAHLTELELQLWALHYEDSERRRAQNQ